MRATADIGGTRFFSPDKTVLILMSTKLIRTIISIADRIRNSIEAQKEKEKLVEEKIKEETKLALKMEKYNQVTTGAIKLNSNDKKLEVKNLTEEIEKINYKLTDFKIREKIANDNIDKAKLLEQISICIAPK